MSAPNQVPGSLWDGFWYTMNNETSDQQKDFIPPLPVKCDCTTNVRFLGGTNETCRDSDLGFWVEQTKLAEVLISIILPKKLGLLFQLFYFIEQNNNK